MTIYSDTEYEIDLYGWDVGLQERFYIKTVTSFDDLEIIDYIDQQDTATVTIASSDWDTDTQSIRVIEEQTNNDVYRGRVEETVEVGANLDVTTAGTFTGAEGLVGDVEYSLYVGATVESAPDFQEKITNFSDLSVNQTASSMSDWSAIVPPQPRLEEYGFNRVTIWNEEDDTAFFVGVLEEISTDPQESTEISGRGVLVEEDYNSTSVTYSNINVVDAIEDFATNYLQFDWSFVGTRANVDGTIGTGGKTFTGTHYEIFRDLHNLASLSFNLVYNDWNDVDLQTFQIGEPSPNQTNITIKDYTRGYDYTDYANKITLVGADGLTATADDTVEQNNFGKTIHKTVRKPRLATQTEVDNAVNEALNKATNNRNQSGNVNVVPTSIDVGFDYTFDVFQNFFTDGNYVTQGYAQLPDKDSRMVARRQHIPTEIANPNDGMMEILVFPEIKTLGQNEYVNLLSTYDAPDLMKLYGDGSIGVQTGAMDSEERTQAGLIQHQKSARISFLVWNDIFAGSGDVHFGGVWVDGGDQNNPDLGFFDAGDEVLIDYEGATTVDRIHNQVPLRIGTNHPIKEFSDSLNFYYPVEGRDNATQNLLDNHSEGTTGSFSGQASALVEDTPKGQALSFEGDTDGFSIASASDSFGDLDSNGFTFLAFVNVDELGTGASGGDDEFRTLYGNGPTPESGVTSDTGHTFSLTDTGMQVDWGSDSHLNNDSDSTVFNPTVGEWAQVGVQFNYANSEINFILNGQIVDSTTWTFPDGDYSNVQEFSLFDGSGIQSPNNYTFLGDVADVRLLDGDVTEAEMEEIYKYQEHVNGYVGGIDDIRWWSDDEAYQDFNDISNGYHLVPSDEINDEPIVAGTGKTPLQTILDVPYREIEPSWDGSVLITEILRGYVTMDTVIEPDLDFGHDEGPREGDSNFRLDSYNVSIPTTNTRVEEAQYNLSMDGGSLQLNLDISSRIDTILSESKTEIEDTKQVL